MGRMVWFGGAQGTARPTWGGVQFGSCCARGRARSARKGFGDGEGPLADEFVGVAEVAGVDGAGFEAEGEGVGVGGDGDAGDFEEFLFEVAAAGLRIGVIE